MCPDAELLSAFADDEVPSPWKERLALHVQTCSRCAERLASYARLRRLCAEDVGLDASASAARVKARLESRFENLGAVERGVPRRASKPQGFWGRSVALPLPLAALAATVLVFFTGIVVSGLLRPATSPIANIAAAEIHPVPAQGASMEALVHYLEAQDAQVSLTFRLPPSATYSSAGSPLIVTAPPAAYAPYPAPVEEPSSAETQASPAASPEASGAPAEGGTP